MMAACSVAQHQGDKGMPADQPAGCILGQELRLLDHLSAWAFLNGNLLLPYAHRNILN